MKEREDRSEGQQNRGSAWGEAQYSFESVATSLGIPRESWEHPAVRQFVTLVAQVDEVQAALTTADAQHAVHLGQSVEGYTPGTERFQKMMASQELSPSLQNRYAAAESLLRVASEILTDGFSGADPIATTPRRKRYLRSKMNYAIKRYGLEVVEKPAEAPLEQHGIIDMPEPDNALLPGAQQK